MQLPPVTRTNKSVLLAYHRAATAGSKCFVRCGLGNLADQKFCRGCGHALAGHRAALENNFEEAVEKIKSGTTILGISAVGFIAISLMGLGVWLTQKDAGVFVTLVPVLAFGIPAAVIGLVRLNRAYRALSAQDLGKTKAIEQAKRRPLFI